MKLGLISRLRRLLAIPVQFDRVEGLIQQQLAEQSRRLEVDAHNLATISDLRHRIATLEEKLDEHRAWSANAHDTNDRQLDRIGHQVDDVSAHLARFPSVDLVTSLSARLRRNVLPNDDAAVQKQIFALWRSSNSEPISYTDLLESGFRVFSQSDEDGILLRIFAQIGTTNKFVIEIGSNCDSSDIGLPENLSTNLIVNHGWHGVIVEMDAEECSRMQYFFARDFSTRHFHWKPQGKSAYFSPRIIQCKVSAATVEETLAKAGAVPEPDLFVLDIDGDDFAIMSNIESIKPRVIVVEFEKRFRNLHSVVQPDRSNFSKLWPQSGAASLAAWEKLLSTRQYILIAIGTSGFNAFFVRQDVCIGKFSRLACEQAFSAHPILSRVPDDFWAEPDSTWVQV